MTFTSTNLYQKCKNIQHVSERKFAENFISQTDVKISFVAKRNDANQAYVLLQSYFEPPAQRKPSQNEFKTHKQPFQ